MHTVRMVQQTVYTLLTDRFCTYCGSKGIYEERDHDGADTYCTSCDRLPDDLNNHDDTLAALRRGDPEVIDRLEWNEELTDSEYAIHQAMQNLTRSMGRDLYGDSPWTTYVKKEEE